jgi:hypothetical protein
MRVDESNEIGNAARNLSGTIVPCPVLILSNFLCATVNVIFLTLPLAALGEV